MFMLAAGALALCLALSLITSMFATMLAKRDGSVHRGPLESYLLADGTLRRGPVVSLLVSSSFGLNSVLYQVWLGYSVGAWGLIAQGAWALSFVWLARHAHELRQAKSLHDILAMRFGPSTRVIAALCTLCGFFFLMGWEVAIGRATMTGLFASDESMSAADAPAAAAWFAALAVFAAAVYTVYAGLRGNSVADLVQNAAKIAIFSLVAALMAVAFLQAQNGTMWAYLSALFPSPQIMMERLGLLGLITNVIFSLAWQFVDASTWQSILASADRSSPEETRRQLRQSGAVVFLAPGVIGTLIGVGLALVPNIPQDTILTEAFVRSGAVGGLLSFAVLFACAACIMSLVDGLLLASGYALTVDVAHARSTVSELDEDPERAETILIRLKALLVLLAMLAGWGVHELLNAIEMSLFDFLYVVIIPQLAILGPVAAALVRRGSNERSMTLVIVAALAVGFGTTWVGQRLGESSLVDGAGSATALVSLALAWLFSKPSPRMKA
ncbi:MAG TPA: hypothetical protein VF582_04835 [Allosphingosinicella sp.]|jgi:hypothetical protein